jgi:hypothetical protein
MRSVLASIRSAAPIIAALFILATVTGFLAAAAWSGPRVPPRQEQQDRSVPATIVQSDGAAAWGPAAQPVRVTFDRPDGFTEVDGYHVVVPLYPTGASRWLRPNVANDALDVIGVHSYLLDRDVSGANLDTLAALVDSYASEVQAETATKPFHSTVAGHPAVTHSIVQPGGPRGDFTYDATYVFAGPYLVQVMCQYDRERAAIAKACDQILASLRLAR